MSRNGRKSQLAEIMARNPEYARQIEQQTAARHPLAPIKPGSSEKGSKYRNVKTYDPVLNEQFDSKLENKVIRDLKAKHPAVITQVSVPISRSTGTSSRLRLDGLVIHEYLDGAKFVGEFIDAKGQVQASWRTKANWLLDKFGLKIRVITKESEYIHGSQEKE